MKTKLLLLSLLTALNGCDKAPGKGLSPPTSAPSATSQKNTHVFSSKTRVENSKVAEQVFQPSCAPAQKGRVVHMKCTAYTAGEESCGIWAKIGYDKEGYRITASGHRIRKGDRFCAADKRFKFGTMIDIPGYGLVSIEDRGGSIKNNRLDVFFDDGEGMTAYQRAMNFGVQYLDVTIYDK